MCFIIKLYCTLYFGFNTRLVCFVRCRSWKEKQTGEDGHDDGRYGGRQHADDEGHGRYQAVHHTRIFRHQAGSGGGRLPVGVQADGNETVAGQEVGAGQVGVGAPEL